MCRMTHVSVLSATKHARAAGAAVGDSLRPRRPGPWRSFDTYKCPKRDETERRRWPSNPWRQIARLNGLNACIYFEASPRIRRGVVRLLFRRTKDGDAAFLHAGSIAAAFLHVGSIAAALLRAARALSVQKRHANERDVQKRHGSERSGAAGGAARRDTAQ